MPSQPNFTPSSSELLLKDSLELDTRSDEEIAVYIQNHRPISSPKNVWAFWNDGWDALQGWKKRNVISWVRNLGPTWEVRLLDTVSDSRHNIAHFIPSDLLPVAVRESRMVGRHAPHHTADAIRLPLLYVHGGVWLDVGMFLFRSLDDICWNAISDPVNPHKVSGIRMLRNEEGKITSHLINSFIAAPPHNQFILNWHRIFLAVWENRTDSTNVSKHPLIAPFAFRFGKTLEQILGQDYAGDHVSDYLAHISCFERLLATEDPSTGFSGHAYWKRHFRVLPVSELYPLHRLFTPDGFTEEQSVELLRLVRVEPVHRDDTKQLDAERLVEGSLAHASFKKLSSGFFRNPLDSVSGQWDASEGGNADIAPGTWAAYLRWGSVHLKQTRFEIPVERPDIPAAEGGVVRRVYQVGILEPIVLGVTRLVQGEDLSLDNRG